MQALKRILSLGLILSACSSGGKNPPGTGTPNGKEGGAGGADASEQENGTRFPGFSSIASGLYHACGLSLDSLMYCWGPGSYGALGAGDDLLAGSVLPVRVPGLSGVKGIGAGYNGSCAVLDTGEVDCWGYNWGAVPNTSVSVPTPVPDLTDATQISVSYGCICVLHADSSVSCWGNGYLGDGMSTVSTTPVAVEGLTNVATLAVGATRVFAILNDGTVMGWGDNRHGELGLGTTTNQPTPVPIPIATGATAIASGGAGTCAIIDGSVLCWGTSAAETIPGITGATAVAVGAAHVCVIAGGRVSCWSTIAPGNGVTTLYATSPTLIPGITTAVSVSAGNSGACATLADHSGLCWGAGPLGGPSKASDPLVPVRVEPKDP